MTFKINDRVRVGRHKATVRYVGLVNGQTGTWVGLEWDDASRGKHDGSVSGIQYFRTQHGQTTGSFVRAEKVQRGVGLLEALRLRYTNQQGEAAALEAAEAAAGVRSRVSFLFVGEDQVTERQSKLDQLVRARLVDAMVDHLEAPSELAAALPQLTELDLTANLIHTWSFVVDLCSALPQLSVLNLTGNHLHLQQLPCQPPLLTTLRGLVLNDCGVTWQQVYTLQSSLPLLEEFHLAKNNITSLDVLGLCCSSSAPAAAAAGTSGGAGMESSAGSTCASAASPAAAGEGQQHPTGAATGAAAAAASKLSPGLNSLSVCDQQQPEDQGQAATSSGHSSSREGATSTEPGRPAGAVAAAAGAGAEAAGGAVDPITSPGWALLGQQQPAVELLPGFQRLQVLALEDNRLSSWGEVCRLAALPCLTRLHLSGNPLHEVAYPSLALTPSTAPSAGDAAHASSSSSSSSVGRAPGTGPSSEQGVGAPGAAFPCLQALLLGSTQVSSWRSVDALDAFPGLQELRLSGTPLMAAAGPHAGRRYEVIARVHGLTLLNGADVKPRERRDSELCYVHSVLGDAAAAEHQQAGGGEQLLQQHPRVKQLQAKYGVVSMGASAAAARAGSTLSSTTCELTLTFGTRASKKKLPKSTSVSALKLLISRLFKVAPDRQRLLLHGGPEGRAPEELAGDDTRTLGYYDAVDGCRVEVVEEDPEQRQAAAAETAARQNAELQQRAKQQLLQGDRLRQVAACQ